MAAAPDPQVEALSAWCGEAKAVYRGMLEQLAASRAATGRSEFPETLTADVRALAVRLADVLPSAVLQETLDELYGGHVELACMTTLTLWYNEIVSRYGE